MEKKILRMVGMQSIVVLSLFVLVAAMLNKKLQATVEADVTVKNTQKESVDSILSDCPNYIVIKKNQSVLGNLKWDMNDINKRISISYDTKEPLSIDILDNDSINSERIWYQDSISTFQSKIYISFKEVYEVKVCQDEENIYVALYKPEDLYDTIVVVDAGHGGVDTGTPAIEKEYSESSFNLSVAKKVQILLEQDETIRVYMTRENDTFLCPEQRTAFFNEVNPDFCISIHCNSADNQDASGVEVLYSGQDEGGSNASKKLAKTCLNEIISNTNQVNRGLLEGDNIYIVRNTKAPIALIEIGFLSNQEEFEYLLNDENQQLIADGIVNAIDKMKG